MKVKNVIASGATLLVADIKDQGIFGGYKGVELGYNVVTTIPDTTGAIRSLTNTSGELYRLISEGDVVAAAVTVTLANLSATYTTTFTAPDIQLIANLVNDLKSKFNSYVI